MLLSVVVTLSDMWERGAVTATCIGVNMHRSICIEVVSGDAEGDVCGCARRLFVEGHRHAHRDAHGLPAQVSSFARMHAAYPLSLTRLACPLSLSRTLHFCFTLHVLVRSHTLCILFHSHTLHLEGPDTANHLPKPHLHGVGQVAAFSHVGIEKGLLYAVCGIDMGCCTQCV
eukprot:1443755-Rhodomonas_salina.1